VGLATAITLMMVILAVAMRRNDAAIDAHRGTATATVLSVGVLRTGIEFVAADGQTIRPPAGVLYPGLLHPGQAFLVEYSTANPDLVRVAGRTAAVGNIMIALVLVITWLIAGMLVYLLRRRSGLRMLRHRSGKADTPASPGARSASGVNPPATPDTGWSSGAALDVDTTRILAVGPRGSDLPSKDLGDGGSESSVLSEPRAD
jgi:hypothetical protein